MLVKSANAHQYSAVDVRGKVSLIRRQEADDLQRQNSISIIYSNAIYCFYGLHYLRYCELNVLCSS